MPSTILIVDDDPEIRRLLSELMVLEGYEAAEAADGQEAIDYLQTHEPPCIILLDLMMPGMNGWDFSRALQQNPRMASIPTVVISASSHVRQIAASIPAVAYMDKPLDMEALFETIRKECSHS